jgi:hypothetical protein
MLCNTRSDRRRNRNHSRPSLESLEGRQLLSLGAQFPTPINTTTFNAETYPVNASSAGGAEVVVWTHQDSNTTFDIRAQRLSNGQPVGPEILVSTGNVANAPASVAMDNQGDFVVAWTQFAPNGNTDILAQKYNASGSAVGGIVPVAVGTFAQTQPSVAMDAKGDFVVSYTRNTNNNNPDIFAKLYNVNEQLVNVVSVATSQYAETLSSVAMTPDGRFDVACEIAVKPTVHAIVLNQYSAQGVLTATDTLAASTVDESSPSVSVDNYGDAVVAWQRNFPSYFDVQARRVSPTGVPGPVLTIASNPNLFWAIHPSVALDRDGDGAFVVAYDALTNTPPSVWVAEVSPSNTITTLNAGYAFEPSVSINNTGQYLLTYGSLYTSYGFGGENITGRLGQLPPPVLRLP